MTPHEFQHLGLGDIVRHRQSGEGYVITWNGGGGEYHMAMRQIHLSNPQEWNLVSRAYYGKKLTDLEDPPTKAPTWLTIVFGVLIVYGVVHLLADVWRILNV